MKQQSIDTRQLHAHLLSEIERLVECLFIGRIIHRSAHEYRIGTQGSISIRLADGSYFNHETGEGGDLFALIQHMLKTDFKGALVWARGFVGNAPLLPIPPTESLQKKLDARAARQRDKALNMCARSSLIVGTIVDDYLRQHRAITLSPLPTSLGFIAHAYNYTAGGFYPAMIASVQNSVGDIIAAHCTFLDKATGNKLVGDGVKSRLIFGACRGGAIRLTEATDRLALCEGVEDALSILQSTDWPVWACAGTSNLRAVQIPSHVREVMICSDNDDAGKEAAKDLSARLITEGKRVRIATPPAGVKDFNDLLRMEARHAN